MVTNEDIERWWGMYAEGSVIEVADALAPVDFSEEFSRWFKSNQLSMRARSDSLAFLTLRIAESQGDLALASRVLHAYFSFVPEHHLETQSNVSTSLIASFESAFGSVHLLRKAADSLALAYSRTKP